MEVDIVNLDIEDKIRQAEATNGMTLVEILCYVAVILIILFTGW